MLFRGKIEPNCGFTRSNRTSKYGHIQVEYDKITLRMNSDPYIRRPRNSLTQAIFDMASAAKSKPLLWSPSSSDRFWITAGCCGQMASQSNNLIGQLAIHLLRGRNFTPIISSFFVDLCDWIFVKGQELHLPAMIWGCPYGATLSATLKEAGTHLIPDNTTRCPRHFANRGKVSIGFGYESPPFEFEPSSVPFYPQTEYHSNDNYQRFFIVGSQEQVFDPETKECVLTQWREKLASIDKRKESERALLNTRGVFPVEARFGRPGRESERTDVPFIGLGRLSEDKISGLATFQRVIVDFSFDGSQILMLSTVTGEFEGFIRHWPYFGDALRELTT